MTEQSWRPVVVGVDASPSAVDAALMGWELAQATGATCRLVHSTPEAWTVPTVPHSFAARPDAVNEATRQAARTVVLEMLGESVPDSLLAALEVRTGRPAAALRDAAAELAAGVVVLGGKHHSALGRWVVGSTAHTLVRSLDLPLLVTAHCPTPVRQVVAAIDLSDAAVPTIRAAERYAEVFGATLHVLHVVEPLPLVPDAPLHFNDEEVYRRSIEYLEQHLWPLVKYRGATTGVGRGLALDCITSEVAERQAQLVVLGSHGKGWVDRILIGSVTERVLGALPCSMLIVPVRGPARARGRHGDRTAGHGPVL
jgi:nucleotide-binding universal stress UspA family protein